MTGDVTSSRSPARWLAIEYALVLAGLVGLFCLLFGETFHAGFGIQEEYRIVPDSQRPLRWWLAITIDEDILSESPLVVIDQSLKGRVGVNPLLQAPAWGLGPESSRSVLWLEEGDNGTMTSILWSAAQQPIRVVCEVIPGPGRANGRRTVSLTFSGGPATAITRETFDGSGVLTFSGTLQPGWNELRLAVVDAASAGRRPTGAPLLVLLRRMTGGAPPHSPGRGLAPEEFDGRLPRRQSGR